MTRYALVTSSLLLLTACGCGPASTGGRASTERDALSPLPADAARVLPEMGTWRISGELSACKGRRFAGLLFDMKGQPEGGFRILGTSPVRGLITAR